MKGLKLVSSNPLGLSKDRYDPTRDGISPTILSIWKKCREKARLRLLGWTSRKQTGAQMFGTIAHAVLEKVYGDIQRGKLGTIPTPKYVKAVCKDVEAKWRRSNTKADSETVETMEMMMLLVEAIMPIYFTFWNTDLTRMDWYHLEQFVGSESLNRAYGKYESHLKGKMDGAFKINKDKRGRLWLFETKTKSRIGEQGESNLVDIMPHECQTHLYLGALQDASKGAVPGGVLLNIIRRPNFRLKKKESLPAFAARIIKDIQKRPDYYFIRIRMEIDAGDLVKQRRLTDAMFADFLAWYHGDAPHYHNSDACEDKYGTCEFLKICSHKDFTGMYQRKPRRNELEDA
jgi:hypothetical protein